MNNGVFLPQERLCQVRRAVISNASDAGGSPNSSREQICSEFTAVAKPCVGVTKLIDVIDWPRIAAPCLAYVWPASFEWSEMPPSTRPPATCSEVGGEHLGCHQVAAGGHLSMESPSLFFFFSVCCHANVTANVGFSGFAKSVGYVSHELEITSVRSHRPSASRNAGPNHFALCLHTALQPPDAAFMGLHTAG